MLLEGRYRQQGRNGEMIGVHAPVRQDQDVDAVGTRPVARGKESIQGGTEAGFLFIQQRDCPHRKGPMVQTPDSGERLLCQHWGRQFQDGAVVRSVRQQISVIADINRAVGFDLFPQSVDGRVGDLRKALFEIIEQGRMGLRQSRQRFVRAHGNDGFRPVPRHGQQDVLLVLPGIVKSLAQPEPLCLIEGFGGSLHLGQIIQGYQLPHPVGIGLRLGVTGL